MLDYYLDLRLKLISVWCSTKKIENISRDGMIGPARGEWEWAFQKAPWGKTWEGGGGEHKVDVANTITLESCMSCMY